MAKLRTRFLESDEEEMMHQRSQELLQEMGVLIRSDSVLDMLGEAGASVDKKAKIAKIPEGMVKEAISKAPKSISMCSRDGKRDLQIPVDSIPYVTTNGLAVYMTDPDTGKKRDAARKDFADFARLGDALDAVDIFWTMVVPRDIPEAAHTVHELWISLQNTTKHIHQIEVMGAEDARMQIKLGALVAGGEEELKKRPLFSVVCSPISPLTFGKGNAEAQVELARAGVPVISMDMPLSGISSPVTIGGTINIVNAENLASLVITQTAQPGAPFVYSSDAIPGNMTTGSTNYEGVEVPFIMTGIVQMGKRYGLPIMVGDWGLCCGSDPGLQRPFSEMSSTSLDTLSGTDLCSGIGSIDDAKGSSLEQMILDSYMWENWRGFLRKVRIDDDTIANKVVKQVGHGNSFLTHQHTLKNFKKEIQLRDKEKLRWETCKPKSMIPEARAVVKDMLQKHRVPKLDKTILKSGDELIKEYEKRLSE